MCEACMCSLHVSCIVLQYLETILKRTFSSRRTPATQLRASVRPSDKCYLRFCILRLYRSMCEPKERGSMDRSSIGQQCEAHTNCKTDYNSLASISYQPTASVSISLHQSGRPPPHVRNQLTIGLCGRWWGGGTHAPDTNPRWTNEDESEAFTSGVRRIWQRPASEGSLCKDLPRLAHRVTIRTRRYTTVRVVSSPNSTAVCMYGVGRYVCECEVISNFWRLVSIHIISTFCCTCVPAGEVDAACNSVLY